MLRKPLLHMAVLLAAVLVAAPSGPASAESWNMYTYVNTPEITAGAAMQEIAQKITKQTDGQLSVRLYFGGALPIQATNITQAVSQGGTIQLADDGFPYGNIPIAGILNLPMLLTSVEEFNKAAAVMQPYIEKAFADNGITVLGIYHYTLQVLWSRKELTSFDDIKGMKVRVTSPQQAAFIKAFGGTPITIGTPEVAPALQRGVVDGAITSSTGGGTIWKDLLNYTYRLGPNYFASYIIANKEAFDSLEPGVQKTVRSVVTEVADRITAVMRKEERQVTQQMAQNGMTVTPAKPEDIKEGVERMAPYWEQWAESQGPTAVEALKKIRAAIGK